MSDAAIDPTKTARIGVYMPIELRAELDTWRAAQRPIPPESTAVVQLLRRALEAWRKEQKPERKEQKPERKRP